MLRVVWEYDVVDQLKIYGGNLGHSSREFLSDLIGLNDGRNYSTLAL